jgi:membrane protein DedA with SNARE-associated domain
MNTSFAETALSIEMLGSIAYVIAFGISFVESIAFIGLVIPSTGILIALGFLVSWGELNVLTVLIAVALGGFLGDLISFHLGKHGLQWFKPDNKIFKLEYLKKGQVFFARHGSKSIFFARFISPLRPVVPFVAGLFGMAKSQFTMYAVLGSIFSGATYLGIGYGIGTLSEHTTLHLSNIEQILIGLSIGTLVIIFARRFLLRQGELAVQTLKTVTTTTPTTSSS